MCDKGGEIAIHEGWRLLMRQINLLTLGGMILELLAANQDILLRGLETTTKALKLAFDGYGPLTGLLVHALCR